VNDFRWRLALGLIAAARTADDSAAAQAAPDSARRCVVDSAAVIQTVTAIISLEAPDVRTLDETARAEAVQFLVALADQFRPPRSLTVSVYPTIHRDRWSDSADSLWLDVGGPLYLPLRRNGRLAGIPSAVSAIPELNAALIDAVHRRDSTGDVPIPTWRSSTAVGPLRIHISLTTGTPARAVPLMRTRIPVLVVDQFPEPDHYVKLMFPLSAAQHREWGRVDLRYVVSDDGTVDPRGVDVIFANVGTSREAERTAAEFTKAAIDVISKSRYRPARAGGCPVASRVTQRFTFNNRGMPNDSAR
jgi:hypothetical protein